MGKNENLKVVEVQLLKKIVKFKDKAKDSLAAKRYKKCVKYHQKVLALVEGHEGEYTRQIIGDTSKTIGHILCRYLDKPHKAIPYLKEALKVYKLSESMIMTKSLFEIYYDLYQCSFESNDIESLIHYGVIASDYPLINQETKCAIYARIGRFYFVSYLSNYLFRYLMRGLYYCTEAIKILESLNKQESLSYAYCLYDCGEIYFHLEDYDLSLDCFEKLIQLTDQIPVPNDFLYGVYTNLSNIYDIKGFQDTVLYYNKKLQEVR